MMIPPVRRTAIVAVMLLSVVLLASLPGPPSPGNGSVAMSTDKACYRPGEPVRVTATGQGEVHTVGDFPTFFWAIANASDVPVWETSNPADAIMWLNGTLNGTWNQTSRHFSDPVWPLRPVYGGPVPPGEYTIWFYEIPVDPLYPDTWIPTNVTIGDCSPTLTVDAGPDRASAEGEALAFSANSTGTEHRVERIGYNVHVNDEDVQFGGTTLTNAVLLPNGTAYVTWTGGRTRLRVNFDRAPLGGVFGTDVPVDDTQSPAYGLHSDIAVGPSGKIHVIWWDVEEARYSASTNGGADFSASVPLGDAASEYATSIAADEVGGVHAAWGTSRVTYRASPDDGGTWGPATSVGAGGFPDVAAAANGTVYLVWWGPSFTAEFIRKPPGGTFSPPVTLHPSDSNTTRYPPAIVLGPAGEVYVTWVEVDRTDQRLMFTRSLDEGVHFSPPAAVRALRPDHPHMLRLYTPRVAAFGREGVALAWIENLHPFEQVMESRVSVSVDRGETFGSYARIDDNAIRTGKDSMAIAGNARGDLFAAWNDARQFERLLANPVWGAWLRVTSGGGNVSFTWDFDARVDSDGNGNATDDLDATGENAAWTYGDDGVYTVTLRGTDSLNRSATDTATVTVRNTDPRVVGIHITPGTAGDLGLRVAGRKWNAVNMTLYEDDVATSTVGVRRMPGSPDEQIAWIQGPFDSAGEYVAVVTYEPMDLGGQELGGNPVWLVAGAPTNFTVLAHHTFNVQQSEERNSSHWNHIDPWTVDLTGRLESSRAVVTVSAEDPGSDDLTFLWSTGEAHTHFNDGVGPDPGSSPWGTFPFSARDSIDIPYAPGTLLSAEVRDDDGGSTVVSIVLP